MNERITSRELFVCWQSTTQLVQILSIYTIAMSISSGCDSTCITITSTWKRSQSGVPANTIGAGSTKEAHSKRICRTSYDDDDVFPSLLDDIIGWMGWTTRACSRRRIRCDKREKADDLLSHAWGICSLPDSPHRKWSPRHAQELGQPA